MSYDYEDLYQYGKSCDCNAPSWTWTEIVDVVLEVRHLGAKLAAVKAAVQEHHDQRGDNRCHLDDLKLYHDALGITPDPYVTALPPDADMHESCRRYIAQRQAPEVHGTYPMPSGMTIAQLTEALIDAKNECDEARAMEDRMARNLAAALDQREHYRVEAERLRGIASDAIQLLVDIQENGLCVFSRHDDIEVEKLAVRLAAVKVV